jgi:UTP--glucose-1-phosphate uridylyltransferase
MHQSVTNAIIAASGYNTRRLPVAAAFPKEFMPIGNRPAIDFVIDDLVRAGITDIYLVIHAFQRQLFKSYFSSYPQLEAHLERKHKTAELEHLQELRHRATFHLIEDHAKAEGEYGTTVPLREALRALPDLTSFIYTTADDFTHRFDGGSDTADLVKGFAQTGADGALLGLELPLNQLKTVGVCVVRRQGAGHILEHLVEKPARPQALPEPRLANISKYVFTDAIRPFVMANAVDPASGEYRITDVIEAFADQHTVAVCAARGTYYDVGTLENWLAANQALA